MLYIQGCDKYSELVLENGRLTQTGTHDQLAHRPGLYHETALLQLMDLDDAQGDAA